MSEQQLDLAGSYRVVRDHWMACLGFVLLGLALSVGYVIVRPPLYTATSLVLFPGQAANTGNANSSANDMTTASQVATSAGVLVPAGHHVDPPLSLRVLKQRVKASGVATNVLQITAAGTTAAQAAALANAIANQLVTFETTVGSATEGTVLGGLQAEVALLTTQIEDLNHEIASVTAAVNVAGASSPAGTQDTALLASLSTQQSQATLQLNSVNAQIATVKAGAVASGQGTEVIQRATTANPPAILHKVLVVGLGALAGLLVATLLLLVRHRKDPRLHRRDEIALTVGVPVLMSSSASGRHRTNSDWIKVFEHYSPSDASRWNVQQLLRALELGEQPNHLVVLSIAGDDASLAATIQIAITLSGFGLSTSFEMNARNEIAKPLRAACNRLSTQPNDLRPNFRVWSSGAMNGTVPALILTCFVVDGTRPDLPLVDSPGATLLAVSAGFATANQLASVAIAADDVGLPLKGVIVTNPDSDDRTTGRFPQATPRHARSPRPPKLANRGSI